MIKRIVCFLLVLLVLPALCMADTVILKNGDVFEGKIGNKAFIMDTPYGGIRVLTENIKSIQATGRKAGPFKLLTVNNDLFSGTIVGDTVRLTQTTGKELPIAFDRIKQMAFQYNGPTHQVITTLFFMKNGDLFSGALQNPTLEIRTKHEALTYKTTDFSRIDFLSADELKVEALLDNKTFVAGELLTDRLQVKPECVSRLSLCKNMIRKIQFNARKLVMVQKLPADAQTYDSDGDGVPDAVDKCPDTPCGTSVDATGCSVNLDSDGDGVPDIRDQCPNTPRGLHVNDKGCWEMSITRFAFDRAKINPRFFAALDNAAKVLIKNPQIKIQVQGYTDSSGSAEYNKRLSVERAEAVTRYLIQKGVSPDRLTAVGYGAHHPVAANDTENGRAMNRRVQLEQLP